MVLDTQIEKQPDELDEIKIIKSDNWELPVINLGMGKYTWRPKTACLPYHLFFGPSVGKRSHGLDLSLDLIIGAHGPRGACKTVTLSYLLAKKMRIGQPVWNNWPISFYVIEADCYDVCDRHDKCPNCNIGHKTYYESHPLNFDKLYTFNSEITEGSVGVTEMQYYAESRTSGRVQNRFLGYQLMQIRKSALSFFYDVQNPRWVDNRFGWSDDVKIMCSDVAKMSYLGPEIDYGAYAWWKVRDISGILTGHQYENTHIEYGPYQFDAFNFWPIYPTKWKVDVWDAVYSMKQQNQKSDKQAQIGKAIELAVNSFLDENKVKVQASDMWARASSLGKITVPPNLGGEVLAKYGIEKHQNTQGKYIYDLTPVAETPAFKNDGDKKNEV